MQLFLGLVLCLLNISQVFLWQQGDVNESPRYQRHTNTQHRPDCIVSSFRAVPKIEARKMAGGDWYEVFRTATSYPVFSSGIWRFQSTYDPDILTFYFTAKLKNGKCLNTMSGEVAVSGTNPGTIIMSYDGLKGRVEEEYKVLLTDYTTKAVLYGCRHIISSGECAPSAAFLVILSKYRSLSKAVSDNLRETAKDVCIDPTSLHLQDSINSCNLDHLDHQVWKDSVKGVDWPICKRPSLCTLACPPCCTEGPDGCIHCNCGDESNKDADSKLPPQSSDFPFSEEIDQDAQKSPGVCVTSLSSCQGENCILTTVQEGCKVCDCLPVLKAPPMPFGAAPAHTPDINIFDITEAIECPTTCRIGHQGAKMVCNCTNRVTCETVPPGVPYSCTERDTERYYYDQKTGTCHGFFGSCLNINNNFHTLRECIATCADVCELPLDIGLCPGKAPVQNLRHYHNRVTGECDIFNYGGCGGNDNNFEKKEHCIHKCPSKLEGTHHHSSLNDVCRLPSSKGNCGKNELRYFYLELTKTCTTFFYSGCGGNQNNFESEEECLRQCTGSHKTEEQETCPDITNCDCDVIIPNIGCATCPCDAATKGVQVSFALLFFGLLFSTKREVLSV